VRERRKNAHEDMKEAGVQCVREQVNRGAGGNLQVNETASGEKVTQA